MPSAGQAGIARRFLSDYQRTWRATGPTGRGFLSAGLVYLIRALAFSVAFPLYAKERGFDNSEIGVFLAASQFALFALGIPVTILGARGHSRRLLSIGPLIAAVGLVTLLFAPDSATGLIIAAALLSGAGGATYWVLGDPLLAQSTPLSERANIFALKFFLLTVGVSLGAGLGGWIPGLFELVGFDPLAALTATLIVLTMMDVGQSLLFGRIPDYEATLRVSTRGRERAVRAGKRFTKAALLPWAVMFALAVPELGMALGHNSIRPFLSLFFTEEHNLSASTTGTFLAIFGLLGGIGALGTPSLARRIGNIPAIAIMRITAAVSIMLWFSGIGLPPILGLMVVYYSILDGTEALFITESMSRVPIERRTWFSGIYAMAWSLAASTASIVSGSIQAANDGAFGTAFAVGAAGYTFSVIWMVGVYPRLPKIVGTDELEDRARELAAEEAALARG